MSQTFTGIQDFQTYYVALIIQKDRYTFFNVNRIGCWHWAELYVEDIGFIVVSDEHGLPYHGLFLGVTVMTRI